MHIYISNIERISIERYRALIQIDDESVVAEINEDNADGIRGFNFGQEFFDILFAHDGLGGRFTRDYWHYRENRNECFPWDYGDHDSGILLRALKESKTEIASLR